MGHVLVMRSSGLALRKARGLRVRLPLARLTVVGPDASLQDVLDILRDELNVKSFGPESFTPDSLAEHGLEQRLTVNARALGPRVGKDVQDVIQAAKAGDWAADGERSSSAMSSCSIGEYTIDVRGGRPRERDRVPARRRVRRARHPPDPGARGRGPGAATSCARCSRRARTPAWTSATASR